MKIDRDAQKALGIVGMVLAFVSGALVEYTGHVIVGDPSSAAGMIIVAVLTIIVFGMVAFSEYE